MPRYFAIDTDSDASEPRDVVRIVQHPDGYYWRAGDDGREVGPFPTFEAAELAARADEELEIEPVETLAEAEDEIGMADWIDPETGEPAEEARPRIEDH